MIKIKNKILTALLGTFMVVGGISIVSGNKAVESRAALETAPATTIESGSKYLITTDGYYLTPGTAPLSKGNVKATSFSDLSKIAADKCWTLTASSTSNSYTIENSGFYLANIDDNNGVLTQKASQEWSFAYSDSNSCWTVTGNNSRKLAMYNKKNWRCYTSTSGTQNIILYKFVEDASKTLDRIEISNQKTSFYVGDTFSFTGKCLAIYKDANGDESSLEVIPTFSGVDTSVVGTYTATFSYTEGEKTVTTEIENIDVKNISDYEFSGNGTLSSPFTIQDAIIKAREIGSIASEQTYFVKGNVASKSYYSQYKDYSKLTLTENNENFIFYQCYADENKTSFTGDIINVGDEVIGVGNLINYGGTTAELNSGCYLYDYKVSALNASSSEVINDFKVGDEPTVADLGVSYIATKEDGSTIDIDSSNSSLKITNGLPLVKGDNTLTITYTQTNKYSGKAFASGGTASTTVVVKNVIQPVTSIKIDNEITEINLNEPVTLTATVSPDDANDKTITWSSSDETIATVTDAGVVTGVATGKVTITAKSGDMSDSIELVVKDPNFVISTLILSGERDYFVGEDFDKSFYTVTGVYNDGETELDVTDDVTWDLTNYNKDAAGTYKVSVNYVNSKNESITESVDVKVVEKVLSYIVCEEGDMKTSYTTDDTEVDLTGIDVLAVYKDAKRDTKVTENLNVVKQPDFTTIGSHDVTVSYTDNGITKEDTVTISVSLAKMVLKNSNPDKYEKVTADRDDWSGTYVIVCEGSSGTYAFSGVDDVNGYYDVAINDNFIDQGMASISLTIEKYDTGYSIKVNGGINDGQYIGRSANSNGLNFNPSAQVNTLSFDDSTNTVLITASGGTYFTFNSASNQMRFRYYKTAQDGIQLYRLNDEFAVTEDMYNMVLAADKALVCGTSENGWNGTYDIDTVKENIELLSDAELTALKNAEANQDGNIVEKFLWKYDYLISAGKITDNFLNRNVASAAKVSPIFNNINNDTTIAIIVIISLISVSSIAGFLFLKKRKEQ